MLLLVIVTRLVMFERVSTYVHLQVFIRNNPTQSQPLLQAILQMPSLVGLLAPNFSPNATPELFVDMYEDMLKVPFNQGSDVAFSLLSKVGNRSSDEL